MIVVDDNDMNDNNNEIFNSIISLSKPRIEFCCHYTAADEEKVRIRLSKIIDKYLNILHPSLVHLLRTLIGMLFRI